MKRAELSEFGIATDNRQSFKELVKVIEINEIKPAIDSEFDLTEIKEAYEYLESGKHFGKIVIDLTIIS